MSNACVVNSSHKQAWSPRWWARVLVIQGVPDITPLCRRRLLHWRQCNAAMHVHTHPCSWVVLLEIAQAAACRRSRAPKTGSGVSNTQPPRLARSASSTAFVTLMCGSSPRSTSASITRWHHGHALPRYTWYRPDSTWPSRRRLFPQNMYLCRCSMSRPLVQK